jgi:hypothetical protein
LGFGFGLVVGFVERMFSMCTPSIVDTEMLPGCSDGMTLAATHRERFADHEEKHDEQRSPAKGQGR